MAGHARLGGDLALASRALRDASARAAERYDYAAAEALLDDALRLDAARTAGWPGPGSGPCAALRRGAGGRGAGRPGRPGGARGRRVGVYFGRDFAQAAQFAADGALAADDAATRARCLAVGGRIGHAAGDLATAETLLGEALTIAAGADRVTAAAWLGVLRAHQSRVPEALELLRPAARGQIGVEHTSATLHALLFSALAHAQAGRPPGAGRVGRYTAEVERRQVPRFAGRGVNLTGWVLRSLGARPEAADHHAAALEAGGPGHRGVTIAALDDLAEHCLANGDPDGAGPGWPRPALLRGDLVFGWRLG